MTCLKRLNKAGLNSDPNPRPLLFTTCGLLWSCAGRGAGAPGFTPELELRTQMALRGGQGGCGEGAERGEAGRGCPAPPGWVLPA